MDLTTAFWGMVINNYDETDLALVRQGYPDYIRQLVYTLEVGDSGTPHVQAYIKLFRQQRLSYVKKLFPRGNFKALLADEYKLNSQRYAQKLDATADSAAIINNNPFPDPVVELTSVIDSAMTNFMDNRRYYQYRDKDFMFAMTCEERHRVAEKPSLAKFYVSTTYKNIKKEFWRSICENIEHTHTHTHNEKLFSCEDDITDASSSSCPSQDENRTEGSSVLQEEVCDSSSVDVPVTDLYGDIRSPS